MLQKQLVIFPARAGMILIYGSLFFYGLDIPRASGDDPRLSLHILHNLVYSPRERG